MSPLRRSAGQGLASTGSVAVKVQADAVVVAADHVGEVIEAPLLGESDVPLAAVEGGALFVLSIGSLVDVEGSLENDDEHAARMGVPLGAFAREPVFDKASRTGPVGIVTTPHPAGPWIAWPVDAVHQGLSVFDDPRGELRQGFVIEWPGHNLVPEIGAGGHRGSRPR